MKNKIFFSAILLALFICFNIPSAKSQTLDWVRTTGSYNKQGNMIARDASDNVVSCGYLIHDRMFTRKWDKFGNFLWEKEDTSGVFNNRERSSWIATDGSNNIITLGYRYYGTSDGQPNAIVILKYSPTGTLLFKKTMPGVYGPESRCEIDPSGNIYIGIAATVTGQADYGFNLIKLNPNGNTIFISIHNFGSYYGVNNMRYRNGYIALTGITSVQGFSFNCTTALFDASGNYLWGVVSSSIYAGIDVEVDNGGNVYVVNKGYASGLDDDMVVTKYSVTGSTLFTYFYDNNSHTEAPSRINLQPDGNVVVSGVCTSPVTGLETFKLSSAGSLMWEAFYGTPPTDIPQLYFMATNSGNSEVFLTGTSTISGNPASVFTIKYDALGSQSWVKLYDSTATRGMGLAIASDGSVFVVGLNWWTVLHYLNTTSSGTCDVPTNISSSNITATKATIAWTGNSGAVKYRVRYRVMGTTAWTTKIVTAPVITKTLTLLQPLTTYEYCVRSDCNTSGTIASAYSSIQTFTTICDCAKPTNSNVTAITQTAASVNWTGNSCALKYRLQYRKQGVTAWTTATINAPTAFKNLTGLLSNSVYEYHLRSDCNATGSVNSGWTTTQTFSTPLRLEDETSSVDEFDLIVFPNPNEGEFVLIVNAVKDGNAELNITNILGQKVWSASVQLTKGENNFNYTLENISSGIYFITLKTDESVVTKRINVEK